MDYYLYITKANVQNTNKDKELKNTKVIKNKDIMVNDEIEFFLIENFI